MGKSHVTDQMIANRRATKEVEFTQPLKGSALIKVAEGTQVVLDLVMDAKQRIVSNSGEANQSSLSFHLLTEAEMMKLKKKRDK